MAARKFLVPIDLNLNELQNVLAQILGSDPGSPTEGQFWYNSTSHTFKFSKNGVTLVLGTLDQIAAPGADVSLNSHKITSLADGTADTDAATVGQVNAARLGLDAKESVRVASTGNVDTSSPGSAIDGVTLTSGDRILLKDQTDASENGIYVFDTDSTALARSADADTSTEVNAGMYCWVEEGSANSDSGWILTTDNPITLGTDDLTFAKFAAAPLSSGSVNKFSTSVGNGSSTTITVNHNLGTTDVTVMVYDNSTKAVVEPGVTVTDSDNVTLDFTIAPTSNQYRVVVIG